MHLSQSAMSGVLARVRHALNERLLVASRGGMTLTPLAESLVEPVRSILEQVHRTILVNVPFEAGARVDDARTTAAQRRAPGTPRAGSRGTCRRHLTFCSVMFRLAAGFPR